MRHTAATWHSSHLRAVRSISSHREWLTHKGVGQSSRGCEARHRGLCTATKSRDRWEEIAVRSSSYRMLGWVQMQMGYAAAAQPEQALWLLQHKRYVCMYTFAIKQASSPRTNWHA